MRASPARYGEATALNPDAGNHVITSDARELAAAGRAAQRTWAHFPYYARRYGVRGRRFALSDSGWLATLCDLPPSAAIEQVKWLGVVLSSRGMPQWMLEVHLEMLHEELARAIPEAPGHYDILLGGAAALREVRESRFPPARFQSLAAAFDARVGPALAGQHRGMGGILVSAVADELAGIEQAVPVLTAWMLDAAHFPPEWIAAVHATLAEARA
jgi:hypothetical protein